MEYNIVNREKEIQELEARYNSNKPEFVAIYGRRRVGKTFLINSVFENRFTFKHSGLSPISNTKKSSSSKLKNQLIHFYNSLLSNGLVNEKCPTSWLEAFYLLEKLLEQKEDANKMVVFLDEIQWMDTPKSDFITGLESFWNSWVSYSHNVLLIVCGSSTSWVLDKLINNHGGLYGRLTKWINLKQFNLYECEKYIKSLNIEMSRYDITLAYMTLGGIPYYLEKLKREYSLAQNLDRLFFAKDAELKDEFDRLFSSIFTNHETIQRIVKAINTKKRGLTRNEIISLCNLKSSGDLSMMLKALENGGFVMKYASFGESKRETYYKLVDPFCLFYLNFVDEKNNNNDSYWSNNIDSQKTIVWKGLAFENACFNHIKQIKNKLGISGVTTNESVWSKKGNDDEYGTQIDLIIERKDNVTNMCEIKFYNDEVFIDKNYHFILERRKRLILDNSSKKTIVHNVLITTFGIQKKEYWGDFTQVITLDDLFTN